MVGPLGDGMHRGAALSGIVRNDLRSAFLSTRRTGTQPAQSSLCSKGAGLQLGGRRVGEDRGGWGEVDGRAHQQTRNNSTVTSPRPSMSHPHRGSGATRIGNVEAGRLTTHNSRPAGQGRSRHKVASVPRERVFGSSFSGVHRQL